MSLRFGPVSFTIVFCCVYSLSFWGEMPMFFYYPQVGELTWGWQPRTGIGPGMAWYGFMANAGLAAVILAFVMPEGLLDRGLRNYIWLFPCATMLICVYLLGPFFLAG